MTTLAVILIVTAIVLVCAFRIIAYRKSMNKLNQIVKSLENEKIELQSRLSSQEAVFKVKEQAQQALEKERQEAQKQIEQERKAAFESLSKQMEESFKLLSEQNSKGLRKQNAESITELLKPVAEKFEQFDKAVKDSQEKSATQDASMRELLKSLMDQSKSVGDEAKNLANALMGHSKMQGDFGEMLLVDLLKSSGLEEGIHFRTQSVIRDLDGHEIRSESGKTMIPDVIVYYPDDTEVIIDSKLSLSAYVNYSSATTLEDRRKWAKEHILSITRHVDELKLKDYASYIEDSKKKVDYNIMFIPIEGAFRLMQEEAPLLWQTAKDAKVLIVSQMNLMIVLNMILLSWRRYDQEKNIQEVYSTTQELMSQLKNWMDSFVKIGECLQRADNAYNDARMKLSGSNQSVLKKISKLESLKLSPKRSNAKLKASSRMSSSGFESIIPASIIDSSSALELDQSDNLEESTDE